MRRLPIHALVLAMAIGGSPRAAFAQEAAERAAASKVIALENARNRASEAKDLRALDQILDEGFIYVGDDGKMLTKAEMLKDVKESAVQQVVTESMVAHVHGETAIVTGLYRMKGLVSGKPRVRQGRFVDTWLYKNDQWVSVASIGVPLE